MVFGPPHDCRACFAYLSRFEGMQSVSGDWVHICMDFKDKTPENFASSGFTSHICFRLLELVAILIEVSNVSLMPESYLN
jgi:hypothetical protein